MRRRELRVAREIAELAIVEVALRVLADVLAHEHPCIDDLGEADPRSLRAARRLRAAIGDLRVELRRYRAAVLEPETDEGRDDLPF